MAVRITHFAHGTTTDNEADRATDWRRTHSWQPGWEYVILDGWEAA